MKIMTKVCVLVLAVAWIQVGCHNASLTDPSALTDGTSGDDSGETTIEEVSLESVADDDGVSIEGATINTNQALTVKFSGPLSNLAATVRCEGKLQDFSIEQVGEDEYQIVPNPAWLQKAECVLAVDTASSIASIAKAESSYSEHVFYTPCAAGDDFSNPKTYDSAATIDNPNEGCWATTLNGLTSPVDFAFILDDTLMISMGDIEGEPTADTLPFLTKKLDGDYIEANLKVSEFGYTYEEEDGWGANYGLFVTATPFTDLMSEPPDIFLAFYHVEWNVEEARLEYNCRGGLNAFDVDEGHAVLDDSSPAIISIVRKGSLFSVRCKIDEEDEWSHVNPAQVDLGEAWEDELYVTIVLFSKNAYIKLDEFEVVGGELAW